MFAFPRPPGGQFRRTNYRAGPAHAASRPISPPRLASSPRERSICPDSAVGLPGWQDLPGWRGPPPSGVAKTRVGLLGWRGRSTRSPPLICGPPEWKSTAGQISQATAPRRRVVRAFRARGRFCRPGDQVSREVNGGRAANVAPGPVYLPLLVFSPPAWSLTPENNPGGSARVALRADFWSATGPVVARG